MGFPKGASIPFGRRKIATTLPELLDPTRAALLQWAMDYGIAPHAFNYQGILPNLQSLSAAARRAGVPVFYSIQQGFDLAKEEPGVWVRIRMKRAKTIDPSQLLNQKENPQDSVFHKRQPDGFVGTDFDLMLRSKGVKTIVIGGVATEGAVEGTARSARNLGYDVVVLRDGVGSRNRDLHDMALKLMEQTSFDIASTAEIAALWRQK